MLTISPIYVAAIAILMAVLSTRVGILRGKHNVALGDGGNAELALGIRRFGNLSEYAAMAALLLVMMELVGVAPYWLHAYGITLVALRLIHPIILFDSMDAPLWKKGGRFVAAAGTAALMMAGGIAIALA
ncbi:MAG: MAPEG family protein [Pseudomonadota bacterium]